jgi:ribonuclease P protein component
LLLIDVNAAVACGCAEVPSRIGMGMYSFPRGERLSSRKAIDRLFQEGKVIKAYPMNVFHMPVEGQQMPLAALMAAPKRRLRHATDRNRVKRLMREAYRLNRHALREVCADAGVQVALAFVHIGKADPDHEVVTQSMRTALARLAELYQPDIDTKKNDGNE